MNAKQQVKYIWQRQNKLAFGTLCLVTLVAAYGYLKVNAELIGFTNVLEGIDVSDFVSVDGAVIKATKSIDKLLMILTAVLVGTDYRYGIGRNLVMEGLPRLKLLQIWVMHILFYMLVAFVVCVLAAGIVVSQTDVGSELVSGFFDVSVFSRIILNWFYLSSIALFLVIVSRSIVVGVLSFLFTGVIGLATKALLFVTDLPSHLADYLPWSTLETIVDGKQPEIGPLLVCVLFFVAMYASMIRIISKRDLL